MPEKSYKKKHMTSFQLIIMGFAGVILLGTVLLMLPFSSAEKVITPFHEALFTATSAVWCYRSCGKDTGSYWSLAGQTIILALIQTGGLGVVTVAASCFPSSRKYPSCKEAPCRMQFQHLKLEESSD